jgi:hypothetical protein
MTYQAARTGSEKTIEPKPTAATVPPLGLLIESRLEVLPAVPPPGGAAAGESSPRSAIQNVSYLFRRF